MAAQTFVDEHSIIHAKSSLGYLPAFGGRGISRNDEDPGRAAAMAEAISLE
jgi:hypothetical protein